jgi:hypothetical protein
LSGAMIEYGVRMPQTLTTECGTSPGAILSLQV